MSEFFGFLWSLVINLHLWLFLSAAITAMAIKEGIIQVAVVFGGLFLMLICFAEDWLSIETMSRIFLAIMVGLAVAFFIWIARD